MKDIVVYSGQIEITRKCNLTCRHCLRGDAQNKNMKEEYITSFLSQVSQFDTLTITGGEPSLNVKGIKFLLDELKRLNVIVNHFYIATNGTESSYSREFLDVLLDLYLYQQECNKGYDEGLSMVEMSEDEFHDDETQDKAKRILSAFSFFSVREDSYSRSGTIIEEGRAKENEFQGRELEVRDSIDVSDVNTKEIYIEDDVYLNVNGFITSNCNMSYATQNKKKVCPVNKFRGYIEGRAQAFELDTAI